MGQEQHAEDEQNGSNSIGIERILTILTPLVVPFLESAQKKSFQGQICIVVLMLSMVAAIVVLAFYGAIDSSGTTGLLGAMVGYVFGTFFHKSIHP